MSKYKITIEKTEATVLKHGGEWAKIGQIEKKRDQSPVELREGIAQTYLADEYGYTPIIEKETIVHQTIYEQTVEDLDLISVINAVNKIL